MTSTKPATIHTNGESPVVGKAPVALGVGVCVTTTPPINSGVIVATLWLDEDDAAVVDVAVGVEVAGAAG